MEDTTLPEEPGHDDPGLDAQDAPLAEDFADDAIPAGLPDTPPPDAPLPPDVDGGWLAEGIDVPPPPMPPVTGDTDTPPPSSGSDAGLHEEPQPPAPFEPVEGELVDILPPGQPVGADAVAEAPEEPAPTPGDLATSPPVDAPPMPPGIPDSDSTLAPPPGGTTDAPLPEQPPLPPGLGDLTGIPTGMPIDDPSDAPLPDQPPLPPGLGGLTGDPTGVPIDGPADVPVGGDLGVAPPMGGEAPVDDDPGVAPPVGGDAPAEDAPLGNLPGTEPVAPTEPVTMPDDLLAALGELLGGDGVVTVQIDGPVDVGMSELVALLDAQDVPTAVATGSADDLQAHVAAGTPVVLSTVDATGAAAPARITAVDPGAGTVALERLDGASAGTFSLDALMDQWDAVFGEMLVGLDGEGLQADASLPTDGDDRSLLESLRIGAVEVAKFVLLPIRLAVDLISS